MVLSSDRGEVRVPQDTAAGYRAGRLTALAKSA
jgi:hypothetical protein